jgi:protein-tyrosine phosphatase
LSPISQQALIDYGIRTVIDLRRTQEILDEPDVFSGSSKVSYFHHDMLGDMTYDDPPEDLGRAERVAYSYSQIIDRRQSGIGVTLATLAGPGALPAIYHCAGGQDRTGIISALLLGIAGVPDDTIAEDYGLTARYQVNHYLSEDRPPEVIPAGYTLEAYLAERCPPETMLLTLKHLKERYGGAEGYVRGAGLDGAQIERLRQAIVE